jgi:hypothetical protein
MKRLMIFAIAIVTGFVAVGCGDDDNGPTGPSNTGPIVFTSQLSAANEVPPITNAESGARGTATITFNVPRDASGNVTGAGTANFSVQLTGFPPGSAAIAAHIHPGATGVTGGVLVPVTGLSAAAPIVMGDGTGTLTFNSITLQQDWATQIVANPAGYYFNVHTPLNGGGAVRGQLVRQ